MGCYACGIAYGRPLGLWARGFRSEFGVGGCGVREVGCGVTSSFSAFTAASSDQTHFRENRERIKSLQDYYRESDGQNLALNALCVPFWVQTSSFSAFTAASSEAMRAAVPDLPPCSGFRLQTSLRGKPGSSTSGETRNLDPEPPCPTWREVSHAEKFSQKSARVVGVCEINRQKLTVSAT